MTTPVGKSITPDKYVRLEGSERRPAADTVFLGPADAEEMVKVTLVLRRRPDGAALPSWDYFTKTPPNKRLRLSPDVFASKYGADPGEMAQVATFIKAAGLTLTGTHTARRTVTASGTVAQMNEAFGLSLGSYQYVYARKAGEKPSPAVYRGRDGYIELPADIAPLIIGVFGLDNRRISQRNDAGDPPNTGPIPIETMKSLYQFPANSAAGQNVAVYAQDQYGYKINDIQQFIGGVPPSIIEIDVDASNGMPDLETTEDIGITAAAAPGATIVVYFTVDSQLGWTDLLHRVVHPEPGDPVCSVLTSSYYVAKGDDPATLAAYGISIGYINAMTMAFQDAAIQGVTVCIASGDTGSDSGVGDGKAHVQYPGSDPWVLSCGGTTVGNVNGANFDEYVWNDDYGATGGGVSNYFPLPGYQKAANVPVSLNGGQPGRGVPDVAGNASGNSGYPITVNGIGNVARGTSAVAPLYAGLIAVLNAALGVPLGFLNPLLYQLGESVCRDVNPFSMNPPAGPTDNSKNGTPGYPAGPGWDACTGWGSLNGVALLAAVQQVIQKDCYFILDWSSFAKSGIDEMIVESLTHQAIFQAAAYLVVEWFTPADLGIGTASPLQPQVGFQNPPPAGLSIQQVGLAKQDAIAPNRYTYTYQLTFTNHNAFPVPPQEIKNLTLTASVTGLVSNTTVTSSALIQLTNQSGPFMVAGAESWLSNDIRVFQMQPGGSLPMLPTATMDNTGNAVHDATTFIQQVIKGFNEVSFWTPPNHPFDLIATSETASALDILSKDPQTHLPVYNFAVARVRYQDPGVDAQNVRVFFRSFSVMSVSTAYDQSSSYRRWSDGIEYGTTIPLLGNQLDTIPFFAQPRIDASAVSMITQIDEWNVHSIQHDPGNAVVYTYYGCWLDINQSTPVLPQSAASDGPFAGPLVPILQLLGNKHQCITAEISYDPLLIPPGTTPGSGSHSMLGQRNLSLGTAANPGASASRSVPTSFEMKPTAVDLPTGTFPDELMIDWGNVPAGSVATLYLPGASAADILQQAVLLYGQQNLELADPHTLRCPTGGISYIPIPAGDEGNFTCLLSVDLPLGIKKGQLFRVDVRQLTSVDESGRKTGGGLTPGTGGPGAQGAPGSGSLTGGTGVTGAESQTGWTDGDAPGSTTPVTSWRQVLGAFRITIPVSTKELMLAPEERLLSVLRWILQGKSKANRWYPVFVRYTEQVTARVRALGGDPDRILPSPSGEWDERARRKGCWPLRWLRRHS